MFLKGDDTCPLVEPFSMTEAYPILSSHRGSTLVSEFTAGQVDVPKRR